MSKQPKNKTVKTINTVKQIKTVKKTQRVQTVIRIKKLKFFGPHLTAVHVQNPAGGAPLMPLILRRSSGVPSFFIQSGDAGMEQIPTPARTLYMYIVQFTIPHNTY